MVFVSVRIIPPNHVLPDWVLLVVTRIEINTLGLDHDRGSTHTADSGDHIRGTRRE